MKSKRTDRCAPRFTIALAGNPNVGKSTLFNSLTGKRVHTGNWAGKTVELECAVLRGHTDVCVVDIPGTYSLLSHSEEERIARDFVAFGGADVTVIVCDASALLQNLNLALQIIEMGGRCVLALNFVSEAEARGITVDTEKLSALLGVPVCKIEAHRRKTLLPLVDAVLGNCPAVSDTAPPVMQYPAPLVKALEPLTARLFSLCKNERTAAYLSMRLIDSDDELKRGIFSFLGVGGEGACQIIEEIKRAEEALSAAGFGVDKYKDAIALAPLAMAERIFSLSVKSLAGDDTKSEKIDRVLTGRFGAYPFMLLLLALSFFITLSLANYPSELLSRLFGLAEGALASLLFGLGAPRWLVGALIFGIFRTLGQVVSVMMPPMMIFFPLFALLEDSGYLPRVAYNLDRPFACCGACGKQALSMCMGIGCNAVGIVGCRIIDSKRERSLAILTNSLVPCNGRLPMLMSLASAFYLLLAGAAPPILLSLTLALLVALGVGATFFITFLLSKTVLKGERSSFTIELPPYRRPRFLSVIFHSLTDKCASVLLRAVTVAAPMGLVIWLLANITVGGVSIIAHAAELLGPIGRFFGMDGAILLAFILGIPANEIVLPILVLIYSAGSSVGTELGTGALIPVLAAEGWGPLTALTTAVFALFHWPCSTALLTVYKETKSFKMTLLAFLIPTVLGLLLCALIAGIGKLFI